MMGNLKKDEELAITFHEGSVADAVTIWRDGLNMYLRGLDPFSGRKTTREEEHVQLALLIGAWNTLYCAFGTALRGYYSQSLNLLRTPIEFWMAYWYLRSFPEHHELFTDSTLETPGYNDMLQKIEAKRGKEKDVTVREWIKRLHKFSHVDSSGIALLISPGEGGINVNLGSQMDEGLFRQCTSEAVISIRVLLESLDNMRRLVGYDPLSDLKEFVDRVQAWQKTRQRRAGNKP